MNGATLDAGLMADVDFFWSCVDEDGESGKNRFIPTMVRIYWVRGLLFPAR